MKLHRNAKLGLAGRYALVQTIEQGVSLKGRGCLQRLGFDGLPLAPAMARGEQR